MTAQGKMKYTSCTTFNYYIYLRENQVILLQNTIYDLKMFVSIFFWMYNGLLKIYNIELIKIKI